MIKSHLLVIVTCLTFSSASCIANDAEQYQRDFDHQVQFNVDKIDNNSFEVTVLRHNNATFERMAVFVTRQGKKLCEKMGYSITYLSGVESFNDKRAMPNYIFPPLKVKVTCP